MIPKAILRAECAYLETRRNELFYALKDVFALIDENWLVRDISRDGEEGWGLRQLPYIQRLAKARAVLYAGTPNEPMTPKEST